MYLATLVFIENLIKILRMLDSVLIGVYVVIMSNTDTLNYHLYNFKQQFKGLIQFIT